MEIKDKIPFKAPVQHKSVKTGKNKKSVVSVTRKSVHSKEKKEDIENVKI